MSPKWEKQVNLLPAACMPDTTPQGTSLMTTDIPKWESHNTWLKTAKTNKSQLHGTLWPTTQEPKGESQDALLQTAGKLITAFKSVPSENCGTSRNEILLTSFVRENSSNFTHTNSQSGNVLSPDSQISSVESLLCEILSPDSYELYHEVKERNKYDVSLLPGRKSRYLLPISLPSDDCQLQNFEQSILKAIPPRGDTFGCSDIIFPRNSGFTTSPLNSELSATTLNMSAPTLSSKLPNQTPTVRSLQINSNNNLAQSSSGEVHYLGCNVQAALPKPHSLGLLASENSAFSMTLNTFRGFPRTNPMVAYERAMDEIITMYERLILLAYKFISRRIVIESCHSLDEKRQNLAALTHELVEIANTVKYLRYIEMVLSKFDQTPGDGARYDYICRILARVCALHVYILRYLDECDASRHNKYLKVTFAFDVLFITFTNLVHVHRWIFRSYK